LRLSLALRTGSALNEAATELQEPERRRLSRRHLCRGRGNGEIAEKRGDGLMALYGYRIAQENDRERAVRSALAIQRWPS
jgi:hypothetical protein